jgi:hypothetical protein
LAASTTTLSGPVRGMAVAGAPEGATLIPQPREIRECLIRWPCSIVGPRATLILCTVIIGFIHAAGASEITEPIEQLDAGLLTVMKAGKAAPFQQRYDLLGPLVIRAWKPFDLRPRLRME